MTGFARVRRMTPQGEIVVSLRGVNHRGLDMHFHMQPDFDPLEPALRKLISAQVVRGHLDVRLQWNRASTRPDGGYNRELLKNWLDAFRDASERHGAGGTPDWNAALSLPGMFNDSGSAEPGPEIEAAVLDGLSEALRMFNEHRSSEGAETAAVLLKHTSSIEIASRQIASLRGQIAPALQARLQEKLSELLAPASPDPTRLAQEAALLADRGDIGEEVTRLGLHAARLRGILEQGGETGKKLEFLLQEMHREVNTILSKSSGGGEPGRRVVELALSVKAEVEKLREQSLNLE
jgi:uncharacterized protein (TIGR00255 family)